MHLASRQKHGSGLAKAMGDDLGMDRGNLPDLDALGLAFDRTISGERKTTRRALLRTVSHNRGQVLFPQLNPLVSGVAELSSPLASRRRTFRTWGRIGRGAGRRARGIA